MAEAEGIKPPFSGPKPEVIIVIRRLSYLIFSISKHPKPA